MNNQAKQSPEAIQNVVMEQRAKQYGNFKPTKIKIPEGMDKEERRHLAHPVNILIRDYNDFVSLVLKKMAKKDSSEQK